VVSRTDQRDISHHTQNCRNTIVRNTFKKTLNKLCTHTKLVTIDVTDHIEPSPSRSNQHFITRCFVSCSNRSVFLKVWKECWTLKRQHALSRTFSSNPFFFVKSLYAAKCLRPSRVRRVTSTVRFGFTMFANYIFPNYNISNVFSVRTEPTEECPERAGASDKSPVARLAQHTPCPTCSACLKNCVLLFIIIDY